MHDASLAEISRYYDTLHVWTRLNAGFRNFSGSKAGTIHRWLTDPANGAFSPTTIHQLMLSAGIGNEHPVDALDAGCGYGGTMFALHGALGGQWHGVTISRRQFAVGTKLARQRGASHAITFALQSYDTPQPRTYNLIYAIESLIHSANPANTIRNLSKLLRAGGTFAIVDDMPVERMSQEQNTDLERFKQMWRCPVMPSIVQWCRLLEHEGCDVLDVHELTPLMRPRPSAELAAAIDEVTSRRRWRDMLGLRRIGEAEIGGLLLEKLGREQIVRYTMICARKRM